MSSLAEKLSAQGYAELFLRLDQSALDQVWTAAGADALGRLVTDDRSPTLARFLAAEILFTKASGYPPAEHRPLLASIYTSALSDNYTRMANPWGMPGELDGPVGQHVVTLGEVAIVTLRPLLDDDADVTYGGSEEATFGNSYHYRVKDLAAFYISRIRGAPYRVVLDVGQRDREIARLRRDLGL